ncbi:MAG: SpoIIE family protein phosphatase [Gemmataceae bacterium]
MADLILLTGIEPGKHLPLKGDKITIGRDPKCRIVIKDTMVRLEANVDPSCSISRKHATILCEADNYYIEDGDGRGTKSRNGIYVNDVKVPFPGRICLQNKDRIRICNFVCTFHDSDSTLSVEESVDHGSSLQNQTADKLRIILEISNSLSKTFDTDSLLPRVVEHLFQLFPQAERGFVILFDEASGDLIPRVAKVRNAGDQPRARFSSSIVRQCLKRLEGILGSDLAQEFPESESVASLPIRSLMCAPLWTQDEQPLGAIQLDRESHKKKFTRDDLNLLMGVASQASIALNNARLHQDALIHQKRTRDLELARQVQASLLPHELPNIPGYAFFARYESALEVGGDYYDFVPLPQNRLGILLGDVAGKGVAAALIMVKFSVEARACLLSEPNPAAAITKLNALMSRTASFTDRFVTLIAAVLDPALHAVTLVNAGHPSPLLLCHATGTIEQAAPVKVAGPAIGIDDGHEYGCCQIHFQAGDRLLLFSDGITEAMDAHRRQFGEKRIHPILAQAQSGRETVEKLLEAVKRHATGCNQNDDITTVCFGRATN